MHISESALTYLKRRYRMEVEQGNDSLIVEKIQYSDWCELRIVTNGRPSGEITIRSRDHAEMLLHMLDQLLNH